MQIQSDSPTLYSICTWNSWIHDHTILPSQSTIWYFIWHTPKFLDGRNCESKGKDNGRKRSWGVLPNSQHFGDRGACWSSGMRLGRMTSNQSLTQTCTNPTTSWLVHSWSTFGPRKSHGRPWTHKTHHRPDLGESTTFPLIVYYVLGHGTSIQIAFSSQNSQVGVPIWLPTLLLVITCVSVFQMSHTSPFQTSTFQELFDDIKKLSIQWVLTPEIVLWIFKSPSRLQLPKWELTWERFIPSHSPTLPWAWDVTPKLPSWPALLQALTLVASPRLGLWHYTCTNFPLT